MKKVLNYLRSMQFGLLLLGLTAALSVIGSVIPQEESAMYYVQAYNWYSVLFFLQWDHIFTSWYFIVLVVLLCINLTMCSIVRFQHINVEDKLTLASKVRLDDEYKDAQQLQNALQKKRYKSKQFGERTVYYKNMFGEYGTFITHLGILFTIIFFAVTLYTPVIIDQTCMPGESITLEDGTQIYVEDFHIEDETGRLNYESTVQITLPNGKTSGLETASVNHPVSLGSYKVYQQTYGTIGQVIVTDDDGNEDYIYLEPNIFLSKDGKTGIWFNQLYPDFQQDGDDFSLTTSVSGHYPNPVYTFNLVEENDSGNGDDLKMTPMLAFPGDQIDAGGLHFIFQEPVEYPGLRIKKSNVIVTYLFVIAFMIMFVGLCITFLTPSIMIVVEGNRYTILAKQKEGIQLWIDTLGEE